MSTSIAAPIGREDGTYEARCQAQARNRHCLGPWARIEVILWPTRSWLSCTARYRCVWELYRPSHTPKAALCVLWRLAHEPSLPAHLHHRHDGALDPHVVSCCSSVPCCEAHNRSSEGPLPTNTCWRATPRWARQLQQLSGEVVRSKMQGAIPALLGPMSSDWGDTLTHTRSWLSRTARYRCKRELYWPSYTPTTALCVLWFLPDAAPCEWRRKRPWDASARLHTATCSFGRWTGRVEHLAGALRKSTIDTLDRISRGGEV